MAGFADIVRSGVAIAQTMTSTLQVTVQHYAWTKNDNKGQPVFATAVARTALLEMKTELRRLSNGQEVLQGAKITFLTPIGAQGSTGRREPIDPRDKIILPDGTTGPILSAEGLADPSTNRPYLVEVILGGLGIQGVK